jgi:4-hydroxy-2-oxoheptanedioate aldolase
MDWTQAPLPKLARRLRAGETLFMGWCGYDDPAIAEAHAAQGADAVLIDMQHGGVNYTNAVHAIGLVGLSGAPALARIPVGDYALASRLLDAGAAGIVAPMINSAADARRFASFVKYPPLGERSWTPLRAFELSRMNPEDYFRAANQMHLAFAMIETRAALDELDGILDAPGIDGVLVGPADLSIALSNGAMNDAMSPDVEKAIDHIAARCQAKGKLASAFCIDGARAQALAKRGYKLLSVSNDKTLLLGAIRAGFKAARG